MFIRFERIQRPQSYNDNPITSLSWMPGRGSRIEPEVQHHHHHHHHHNHHRDINNNNRELDDGVPDVLDDHHQQQHLDDPIVPPPPPSPNANQNRDDVLDGWLAVGNCRGTVGVSYTTIDSHHVLHRGPSVTPEDKGGIPRRTNYNLRGHRSEIVLVRWNEQYQKLASCDRNGVIFVWIKYEGRWSIELINDRNTRVTDFAWSHDGRMALICYMDGFVLVGSVSGQRYWSSMLNLNECAITCGKWTPNNQHVLFGTSNGHILVISVHGVFVTQISVQEGVEINGMTWACRGGGEYSDSMLAVSFVDGTIYLMRNYDEVFPYVIETRLLNVRMEWSADGRFLAVGGHQLTKCPNGTYAYTNVVRFHHGHNGTLAKSITLDYTWQPLSAMTWACHDRRLFIACGQLLYVGWIMQTIPSLSYFSGLQVYRQLRNENDLARLQVPEPVRTLLAELFASTIHCYLPDYSRIAQFVFRPPGQRLHCTLMRHEDHPHQSMANNNNSNTDTIYILYLEYLGGLVPILKGKRCSKIKPEFIIFNPQYPESSQEYGQKNQFIKTGKKMMKFLVHNNQPPVPPSSAQQSSSSWYMSATSDSETDTESSSFMAPYLTPKTRRRLGRFRASSSAGGSGRGSSLDYHQNHHHRTNPWIDDLPETERIVLVTSNIWGTKFKFLGLTSALPPYLGSVTYRTSLLHLQPRQMSLVIKELNETNTLNQKNYDFPIRNQLMNNNNNNSSDTNSIYYSTSDSEDDSDGGCHSLDDNPVTIVPLSTFHSVRNSMLGQAPPPVPPETARVQPPPPSSTLRSQINQECHSIVRCLSNLNEEFLTLQINQSDSGTPVYNVEIKPSSSSAAAAGGSSSRTTVAMESSNGELSPLSPPAATKSTMVRQFRNQTFQSESPKHVPPGYYANHHHHHPAEQSSSSPKQLYSSPNISPTNKQIIRSKILKESPRKSSVSYCSNEFGAKTTGYAVDNVCDNIQTPTSPTTGGGGGGSATSTKLQKKFTNETTFSIETTGNGTEIAAATRTGYAYQTYHIYDDSDLVKSANTKTNSNITNTNDTLDQDVLDSESYFRNVEQLVKSLSQKLASSAATETTTSKPAEIIPGPSNTSETEFIRRNSLPYGGYDRRETSGSSQQNLQLFASQPSTSNSNNNNNRPVQPTASLPASPLMSAIRKTTGIINGANGRRSSQGRHFFSSPKVVRKLRRKLNYLDCSSEDEAANTSDDDEWTMQPRPSSSSQFYPPPPVPESKSRFSRRRHKRKIHHEDDGAKRFVLQNKAPLWNEVSQVYQLDFGGRVTQESAKNFQIEHQGHQVMQFGRIDTNAYTLDFEYPFSAVQAMAVALANVTQRLK